VDRPLLRPLAAALVLGLASAGAWALLQPLPWPARAFTTFLTVPLPLLLILQARLAHDVPPGVERETVYFSSALTVWILAAFAMLAARFSGFDRADLRLVSLSPGTLLAAAGLTTLAGLALMATGRVLRLRETPIVRFLIPRTTAEKIAFAGLSVSAGVAEEILFRSFLIAALAAALGSLPAAVGVSILVFAATHAYQGWTGTLRVGLLGIVLTTPFLMTGSVYPSIIAHTALDLIAGIGLARWLAGPSADR
jgi:uncharacterized protein